MAEEQKKSSSNEIIWIMAALAIVGMILWYFLGTPIKSFYLTVKLLEVHIINAIFPTEYLQLVENFIAQTPVHKFASEDIINVGTVVGYIINIPLAILLIIMAYVRIKSSPVNRFKRSFDIDTFAKNEVINWPYINPTLHTDIIQEPLSEGPYAMAYRPYDLAVKMHLLSDPKNTTSLIESKAEKYFTEQLGKLWTSPKDLRTHERALLACFCAHLAGEQDLALDMFNNLALQANTRTDKIDFEVCKPLYKFFEHKEVKKIFSKHAYVYTVFASILESAKLKSNLPTSFFIWLKPRDRKLFLLLNCVGRQVSFVECAGIWGHWLAEKTCNQKLDVPYIENSVEGLKKALAEVKVAEE